MSGKVSQAGFDSVVMENIDEFEMEPEEALKETIEQFTAQGVNLALIVKDVNVYLPEQNGKHKVLIALQKLKEYAQDDFNNLDGYCEAINTFILECNVGYPQRILAGENGAFQVIMDLVSKSNQNDNLALALNAGCALCTGYPDLLTQESVLILCNLLRSSSDVKVLTPVIQMIRLNCTMAEKNKQYFMTEKIYSLVFDALRKNPRDIQFLKEIFAFIRKMTMDDDLRVPFSNHHERARMLVDDNNILPILINLCNEHLENDSLLPDLFQTLKLLAVRDEFCKQIIDLKGVDLLLDILKRESNNKILLRQVMLTIHALARSDDVKHYFGKNGGVELIMNLLEKYIKVKEIIAAGYLALKSLTLRQPENGMRVMDARGAELILNALTLHDGDTEVMKYTCDTLRNILARNKQMIDTMIELGAEPVIERIFNNFPECKEESKLVLIELGTNIILRTEWAGQGHQIPD